MTYREEMIEVIKIACQDVIDRVEDLVPCSEGLFNVDLKIHIPSLTDDPNCIPTVTLNVGCYPNRIATDKILELLEHAGKGEKT